MSRAWTLAGVVAAGALGAEIAAPAGTPALAGLDALVAVAFAASGGWVARASPRVGGLAVGVAAAWGLGTLAGLAAVPGYLAGVAVLLHRAPLLLLLLDYPGHQRQSPATRALAFTAGLAPFAPSAAGPTVTAAVAALVALTVAARARRASLVARPQMAAAALAAASVALAAALGAADVGAPTELLVIYDLVLIATAIGLLIPLAVGRWTATATSRLVVELGSGPGEGPLTTRLAQALRDPRLELRLRLPDGEWVNESGSPVAAPAPDSPERISTRRVTGDGAEIALLHDPSALPDRAVAQSAVLVAGTAVDNARRDREVRGRIADLRELRQRLLDAADQERRELELELRSGALRELEEIDLLLSQLPGPLADKLRREVTTAGSELVDLANGLHPAELLRAGLGSALADIAEGVGIPVELQITDWAGQTPPAAAVSAYYLAVETLANVTKHAGASRARVELTITEHDLVLRVSDDGKGGADPEGSGLRGLRDRASAANGHLRVHSPPGAGTLVEARLSLTPDAPARLTTPADERPPPSPRRSDDAGGIYRRSV